jgi:phosphatidylserine decarboxylase
LTKIASQEDINFLLSNRLPRRLATTIVGKISKSKNRLICRTSIALWKFFADLDLSDAATTDFASMHECFTRALKPGARPFNTSPDVLVSPCDAIVGACGLVEGDRVYQAKGYPYSLTDLIGDAAIAETYRNGQFVTLRLTSSMYHRFHAPYDLLVRGVSYTSGDTWNVNPIALKRVKQLFCKNERAVINCELLPSGVPILLVPVAAILVASIRLHFCDTEKTLRQLAASEQPQADSRVNQRTVHIDCQHRLSKGEEMGWFEHGSTIILFVPHGFALAPGLVEGTHIKAGEALLHLPR